MNFGATGELQSFRAELRAWLAAHTPPPREPDEAVPVYLQRWHQELYRGGWVGLSWPQDYGGRGLSHLHEAVLNEEIGAAGLPDAPRIGYLGRAIQSYGTQEQRDRFLPPLLRGDDAWCQGFSEPGAGSDLAAVATRAAHAPGGYVVTGQKVWTSYGDWADWCLLLARTGAQEERHRGLTAFALRMSSPGVEVRPLKAITGSDEFCEIFLTDVFVPETDRIGQEGDGWPIAMMTVSYERGAADVGYLSKFGRRVAELERTVDADDDGSTQSDLVGDIVLRYLVLSVHVRRRLAERAATGAEPGPEMSVDKLLMTELDQSLHEGALKLAMPQVVAGGDLPLWQDYLYSRAASIYGGSDQIQRNIIAQRLLGLPRD